MTLENILRYRDLETFLQQVAQAVATVLKFDVTITDRELYRVAGTGKYAKLIGQQLPQTSSFGKVLRTKEPSVIFNPREEEDCLQCESLGVCTESCHISYPLIMDGHAIGVLALIGFTEEQRQRLAENYEDYLTFVARMAQLVVSSAKSEQSRLELKEAQDRLQGIVEAVPEGILAIDGDGVVICCNQAAARILNVRQDEMVGRALADQIPDAPLLRLLEGEEGYRNRQVSISSRNGILRHVTTANPLKSNGKIVGAVSLLKSLQHAKEMAYTLLENQPDTTIDNILTIDKHMQEVKQMALRAAQSEFTVLIRGESGTGKELFARAIHHHSPRSAKPFVAVNCAALPEDLLESELFGYEEGAFTGAKRGGKPGKFELAHQGTLFLDEVADCSLRLQAKLLRVLDSGECQRIGGTETNRVDVRVVAATNRDLESMVAKGEFREDLYFRLNVVPIRIPPLRERKRDIRLLMDHFMSKFAASIGRSKPEISPETLEILTEYPWPGNVRELENTVQYLLTTYTGERVEPPHLPARITESNRAGANDNAEASIVIMPVQKWEQMAIKEGLKRLGRTPQAKETLARMLGMSRSTLYRKIRRYKLDS